MHDVPLLPGEHIDDLMFKGLKIIQNQSGFRFGMDAVLLARFAHGRGARVLDLGTGTGIVPLLMAGANPRSTFTALELQRDMAQMAQRSVEMNGLQQRIDVRCGDLRAYADILERQAYDTVTCNPPYTRGDEGRASQNESQALARHEQTCTLDDVARAGYHALKYGGHMALIIRAQRTVDIFDALRRHRLEPKRACLVCPRAEAAPKLLLVEAIKHARPGMVWEAPLIVSGPDGTYTPRMRAIYHMEENDG